MRYREFWSGVLALGTLALAGCGTDTTTQPVIASPSSGTTPELAVASKSWIERAEMVQKIHAAVDARDDPDLVIVARTDAIAVNGFDDAMERAAAYIEAGADMTFVEAPRSKEQIAEIPKRLPIPQLINMVAGGLTPMIPRDELESMGYAMVLYANAALQAAVAGMQNVLGHLKERGSLAGVSSELASFDERQRLVKKPQFDALEKKYS